MLIAYLGLPQVPGVPAPTSFLFFWPKILPSDQMDMSHFLKEMAEQILMRYQVKLMIAQLLSFATILVTMPRPHGDPQPVLLF